VSRRSTSCPETDRVVGRPARFRRCRAAVRRHTEPTASGTGARGGAGLKPPRLNTVWPVPALIDTACADLCLACGRAMLRAQWAWRYRMRVNPRIESADQGPTSPRGSGEAVRMGAAARSPAATISLPQTSRPGWLAAVWSSGFGGRLNFLCAKSGSTSIACRRSVPLRDGPPMHFPEWPLRRFRDVACGALRQTQSSPTKPNAASPAGLIQG
jgi:hypothetical protein